jgi:hypothetical protein
MHACLLPFTFSIVKFKRDFVTTLKKSFKANIPYFTLGIHKVTMEHNVTLPKLNPNIKKLKVKTQAKMV